MSDWAHLPLWRQRRNKALVELDVEWCRAVMNQAADEETVLSALHKCRYECADIPAEMRHASGAWLRERGWNRMDNSPLLPEGQLPGGIDN